MEGTQPVHGGTSRRSRRVLKALFWTACVLLLALGVGAYLAYRSAGSRPAWYAQPDPAAASQPAHEAENKLIQVQNWTGSRYAWDYAHATGRRPLVREPDPRLTLTLAEDEVNALLQKWFVVYGQEEVGGRPLADTIRDPMVHFTKDGITFAATVADLDGRVISADVRPTILPDGQLNLQLGTLRAGTLPLPELAWSNIRTKLLQDLNQQFPRLIREAALDRGGGVNGEFVAAISTRQAIDALQQRPTINAMFLPVISEGNALPVKVEAVEFAEGSMTLTVQTMTPQERQDLISRVRK